MSQDVAARLGALAKDHREGRLSVRAYRDLRAPLLDLLVTREMVDGDATRPRVLPQRPAAAPITAPAHATAAGGGAEREALNRRAAWSALFFVWVGMGVLVAGGGVVAAWKMEWLPRHLFAGANTTRPSQEITRDFIRTFVEEDDWSDERIRALNARLDEAGGGAGPDGNSDSSARSTGTANNASPITQTQWGRRLADAVRARLLERQALGAKLLDHSDNPLADLAVRVGIDFRSLEGPSSGPPPEEPIESVAGPEPKAVVSVGTVACTTAIVAAASASSAPASILVAASAAGSRSATCQDKLASGEPGPKLAIVSADLPFAVSLRQVSQSQFRLFCDRTSRAFPRQPWEEADDPIVNVTWDEARDYLQWLSTVTGHRYRLPTETEWEHAAGVVGVGAKSGVGKVREWVEDSWSEGGTDDTAQHVVRGTSYADHEDTPLSARRGRSADTRDALTGFRALREIS